MKYLFLILIPSFSFGECTISTALQTLNPGAHYNIRGSQIEWLDTVQVQPSNARIIQAISDCQTQETTNIQTLKNDITVIKSSSSTVAQKLQAYSDLLQQKGLLQ